MSNEEKDMNSSAVWLPEKPWLKGGPAMQIRRHKHGVRPVGQSVKARLNTDIRALWLKGGPAMQIRRHKQGLRLAG